MNNQCAADTRAFLFDRFKPASLTNIDETSEEQVQL